MPAAILSELDSTFLAKRNAKSSTKGLSIFLTGFGAFGYTQKCGKAHGATFRDWKCCYLLPPEIWLPGLNVTDICWVTLQMKEPLFFKNIVSRLLFPRQTFKIDPLDVWNAPDVNLMRQITQPQQTEILKLWNPSVNASSNFPSTVIWKKKSLKGVNLAVTLFVQSIKGFQIVNHKCEANLCTIHVLWVE